MPLLPPQLRPYLSDTPAIPSMAGAPSAMAGLNYDAATRAYVDQMGRIGSARGQYYGPISRLRGVGRVADRFILGPGNNLTPSLQAARAARGKLFRNRLGLILGAGTLAAGALGGAYVGLPGKVISGAGSAASATANTLFGSDGLIMRSDPLGLFQYNHKIDWEARPDLGIEAPWAQQSWMNRAESLFRPRGYQGPGRALMTRIEHPSLTDPDGTTRAEVRRVREARRHNYTVDRANAEAARRNAAAERVNQMTQRLNPSAPTVPIVPMQPRMNYPAVQTGTEETNIQYPQGYQGPGRAYQTGTAEMNIQYPQGYQGPGRAYQTGTDTIGRGWLGGLSSS